MFGTVEVNGIRGEPRKTWWEKDMRRFGVSQEDAEDRNKRRREVKGQLADQGSPGKWALKWCVGVCFGMVSLLERCLELLVVCVDDAGK